MASTGKGGKSHAWIIDSGATNHMTSDKTQLSCFEQFVAPKKVEVANGDSIDILGYGNIHLSDKLILKRVLYVPRIDCNLISVKKLMDDSNCWTLFTPSKCFFLPSSSFFLQEISTKEKMIKEKIGNANHCKGLYFLEKVRSDSFERCSSVYSCKNNSVVPRIDRLDSRISHILLWHKRMGHPNFLYMKNVKPDLFNGILLDCLQCETCIFGKLSRAQYPAKDYKESKPFNLIHSDIWGPSRVLNVIGSRWFVIFVDDHARVTWIYLMKHKSELSCVFKTFIHLIQNQFNTNVKTFRSDNGGEYLDKDVKSFLDSQDIHHQTSNVYTPSKIGWLKESIGIYSVLLGLSCL